MYIPDSKGDICEIKLTIFELLIKCVLHGC